MKGGGDESVFGVKIDDSQAKAALGDLIVKAGDLEGAFAKAGSGSGSSLKGIVSNVRSVGKVTEEVLETVYGLGQALFDLGTQGQGITNLHRAFEALGGTSADLARLREQTSSLVPDSTLVRMSNMAKTIGITNQQFGQLSKVATGAAFALGRDFNETLERLVLGAGKMEKELLDELGITFGSMAQIQAKYAKEHGINAAAITDAQKRQIFIAAILKNSTKQQEMAVLAAGDAYAEANTAIINYTDAAKQAISEAILSVGAFDKVGASVTALSEELGSVAGPATEMLGSALSVVLDLFAGLAAALGPLIEPLSATFALFEGLGPAIKIAGWVIGTVTSVTQKFINLALVPVVAALELLIYGAAKAASALGKDGLAADLYRAKDGFKKFRQSSTKVVTSLFDTEDAAKKTGTASKDLAIAQTNLAKKADTVSAAFKKETAAARALRDNLSKLGAVDVFLGSKAGINLNDVNVEDKLEALNKFNNDVMRWRHDIDEASSAYATALLGASGGDEAAARERLALMQDIYRSAEEERFAYAVNSSKKLTAAQKKGFAEWQSSDQREAEMKKGLELIKATHDKLFETEKKEKQKAAKKAAQAGKKRQSEAEKRAKELADAIMRFNEYTMSAEAFARMKLEQERAKTLAVLEGGGRSDLGAKLRSWFAIEDVGAAIGQRFLTLSEQMKPLTNEVNALGDAFGALAENNDIEGLSTHFAKMAAEQERLAASSGSLRDLAGAQELRGTSERIRAMNDDVESSKRQFEALTSVTSSTGTALEGLFGGLAKGSSDATQLMRDTFGALFMDISVALIALAQAQIAASVNPFVGLVAAIALKAIASTISGAITGGGGASSGSGASSGGSSSGSDYARRAQERNADAREAREEPQVINYNYGFYARDEQSSSVGKAAGRAQQLKRGRRRRAA